MNYKKLIPSRKLRISLLEILDWVPDEIMLRLQYRIHEGRKLNLKDPNRFSEKIQWYKLYYKDPVMKQCVDKYDVRKYIADLGYEHLLNTCYGIYNKFDDIDFDKLPSKFVIKDTLGGGGNSVIIVKDKSKIDFTALKTKLDAWVSVSGKSVGREWVYENKHRIIIEKYIETDDKYGLIDYKFFCFNGVPRFCYIVGERQLSGSAKFVLTDENYNILPVVKVGKKALNTLPPKPVNFDKMKELASILSERFPEVRVDFYNIDGRIIFGELTFFSDSGYISFNPDSYDKVFGDMFDLLPAKKSKWYIGD